MDPETGFNEYVRARLASWLRVAYLLTGNPHQADDLVQDALVRVASRWEQVSAAGDPDAYVRRVIYTQRVSWWRRLRTQPVPAELSDGEAGPGTPDPADRLVASMLVRQALARLAPRQRAVLVLRYFEDLTETQTAEVLGCAVGTVKSQCRDALARLRVSAPELVDLMPVPQPLGGGDE